MNGFFSPAFDPVAFQIFGLEIRWYGLAYIAGFLAATGYLNYQIRRYPSKLTHSHVENLFSWGVLGVIAGGRLGYTLFYNPQYYLSHPVEVFYLWQGGMSYHGGLLGVVLAILLFAKKHNFSPYEIGDRLAPGACAGLFFGRLANFVNGELFGRVTDVPWAVIFPQGGLLPRHPSQLYEAALEGVILFIVLHFVLQRRHKLGEASGLFLLGYGLSRLVVEFFRQPDAIAHLQQGFFLWVTMGQLLSLPMVAVGLGMVLWSRKHKNISPKKG